MKRLSPRSPGSVTLQNVADAAGVSVGSVSAIMNNRHVERRIAPETVKTVRAVAEKLGYFPNIGARRLRRMGGGAHNPIVAFVTSYGAPFNVANQFMHTLRRSPPQGGSKATGGMFSVLVEMFTPGRLCDLPGLLTGDHFNAAIIANTTSEDDKFLLQTTLNYPVVLVNRAIPHFSCVLEDPKAGAMAAEVFVRQKRRTSLAVLHGTPITQTTHVRLSSFISASIGLLGQPATIITAPDLSELGAFESVSSFLDKGPKIDALYAVTDSMALGAYHAIKRRHLRIPDDIAVIGVGDHEVSAFYDPPLSWIGVARAKVGEAVNQLLQAQLRQPGRPPVHVQIPVQTILRGSTGDKAEF